MRSSIFTIIICAFTSSVSLASEVDIEPLRDQCLRGEEEYCKQAAIMGDAESQNELGGFYLQRYNYHDAIYWIEKSAENGNTSAMYNLSNMYHKGEVVTRDLKKSITWMRKAAELNHPKAQYNLCQAYLDGDGIERNQSKAFIWCKKSADQYVPQAIAQIGLMYFNGVGTEKNEILALKYNEISSVLGFEKSYGILALIYASGSSFPADYKKSEEYIAKSIKSGDIEGYRYANIIFSDAMTSRSGTHGIEDILIKRIRSAMMYTFLTGQKIDIGFVSYILGELKEDDVRKIVMEISNEAKAYKTTHGK